MYLLGLDIGSSRVKASIIDANTGLCLESTFAPMTEMTIQSEQPGWAEQDPEVWWQNVLRATREAVMESDVDGDYIKAIGISYQMHGLVLVDENQKVIYPSIIWCDSRATGIGNKAFDDLGAGYCLDHYLNSPGNFTVSKLNWMKENHQVIFENIHKAMLPGDYIAMRLTGEINTTVGGLSEAIMWDFKENKPAYELMEYFGVDPELIPDLVPTFGISGGVKHDVAEELGLRPGTPVSYRAGDQSNNAFSLNVLEPGQLAATGGTSGVIYGVTDKLLYDPMSRVNSFAHVNHSEEQLRLGVLLCMNGTGILNSWLKNNIADGKLYYDDLSRAANEIGIGSDGLVVLPFGNGAERMLGNQNVNAQFHGICFNIHTQAHLFRAAHEGIAYALNYGMEIMHEVGIEKSNICAGKANMFLSPIFRNTLAGISGAVIELYNTDGSQGAARAAGVGAGIFNSNDETFSGLIKTEEIEPDNKLTSQYSEGYELWKETLGRQMAARDS
jgi:xylulokinase